MRNRYFQLTILLAALLSLQSVAVAQTAGGFRSDSRVVENILYTRPVGSNRPVFLRDTLEVQMQTKETYWKVPNQNYYTSWVPRVNFHVLYDDSSKLRYTAEWFDPDGSPWFTESLTYNPGNAIASLRSDYSDELMNTKAVVTTGTYGSESHEREIRRGSL